MNALTLLRTRLGVASAVAITVVTLGLLAAQPVAAADLGHTSAAGPIAEQTNPEPPDPAGPGEVPGGDAVPGEGAIADGGSATPWVMAGVLGVLLLALGAAFWVARRPREGDIDPSQIDTAGSDSRYIPPGAI